MFSRRQRKDNSMFSVAEVDPEVYPSNADDFNPNDATHVKETINELLTIINDVATIETDRAVPGGPAEVLCIDEAPAPGPIVPVVFPGVGNQVNSVEIRKWFQTNRGTAAVDNNKKIFAKAKEILSSKRRLIESLLDAAAQIDVASATKNGVEINDDNTVGNHSVISATQELKNVFVRDSFNGALVPFANLRNVLEHHVAAQIPANTGYTITAINNIEDRARGVLRYIRNTGNDAGVLRIEEVRDALDRLLIAADAVQLGWEGPLLAAGGGGGAIAGRMGVLCGQLDAAILASAPPADIGGVGVPDLAELVRLHNELAGVVVAAEAAGIAAGAGIPAANDYDARITTSRNYIGNLQINAALAAAAPNPVANLAADNIVSQLKNLNNRTSFLKYFQTKYRGELVREFFEGDVGAVNAMALPVNTEPANAGQVTAHITLRLMKMVSNPVGREIIVPAGGDRGVAVGVRPAIPAAPVVAPPAIPLALAGVGAIAAINSITLAQQNEIVNAIRTVYKSLPSVSANTSAHKFIAQIVFAPLNIKRLPEGWKPRNSSDYIASLLLTDAEKEAMAAVLECKAAEVLNLLANLAQLKKSLKQYVGDPLPLILNTNKLEVNSFGNLSLSTLNPAMLRLENLVRRQRSKLTVATPGNGSFLPDFMGFPGMASAPGIAIDFRGGAMVSPPTDHPIEMRGGGYDIAIQKGGFGLIGPFRPIADESFISSSLETAIATLRSRVRESGSSISADTDQRIEALVQKLKDTETQVKNNRDNLISVNNAIATGRFTPKDGVTYSAKDIATIAKTYNEVNKVRQSLENKLTRVLITLNGITYNLVSQ